MRYRQGTTVIWPFGHCWRNQWDDNCHGKPPPSLQTYRPLAVTLYHNKRAPSRQMKGTSCKQWSSVHNLVRRRMHQYGSCVYSIANYKLSLLLEVQVYVQSQGFSQGWDSWNPGMLTVSLWHMQGGSMAVVQARPNISKLKQWMPLASSSINQEQSKQTLYLNYLTFYKSLSQFSNPLTPRTLNLASGTVGQKATAISNVR